MLIQAAAVDVTREVHAKMLFRLPDAGATREETACVCVSVCVCVSDGTAEHRHEQVSRLAAVGSDLKNPVRDSGGGTRSRTGGSH